MLGNFKTTNPRTIKDVLGYGAESNKITTARTGISKTRKRGNTRSMFAGALAYLHHAATQTFNVTLTVTNGTTEYVVDRVQIEPGDSAVWMENEYGIVLDEDQYVKIEAATTDTFASNDELSVFLHTREIV
jgi:plastocyanin